MARRFQLSEPHFVASTLRVQRPCRRRVLVFVFAAVLLCALQLGHSVGISALLATATAILVALCLRRFLSLRARNTFRNSSALQAEQSIELRANGFVLHSSQGSSEMLFAKDLWVKVLDDYVLVRTAQKQLRMIPRTLLTDFEQAQFRALA